MDDNKEQILIIYSVDGTKQEDLNSVQEAVADFAPPGSTLRAEPLVFEIPAGAAPGATLGTELSRELENSLGAIVFVDDLRPNVVYELGFFHGRGRTVLLVTREQIDSVWMSISDLAGAAVASLNRVELAAAVHNYLDRLYDEIKHLPPWVTHGVPTEEHNLLNTMAGVQAVSQLRHGGPYGKRLIVDDWRGATWPVMLNLTPGARAALLLRGLGPGADYSVYFQVRFTSRSNRLSRAWLGLASRRRHGGFTAGERTLPSQAPTQDWRMLTVDFGELVRQGSLLGASSPDHLERVRIRAGHKTRPKIIPIEIGFLSISGVDL